MIFSFDIFDTLLTRRIGHPTSLFLLLGDELRKNGVIDCSSAVFRDIRVKAELRAITRKAPGDPSATDIYAEVAHSLSLSNTDAATLFDYELALQKQYLVPVSENVRVLEEARTRGRIIYLSDMYLPSAFLRELLTLHGIWRTDDKLYVSCEQGATKRHGRLFKHVCNQEGTSPSEFVHHGDDEIGDIQKPPRSGWGISPLIVARLNEHEKQLDQFTVETGSMTSLMAGASRQTRLAISASNNHERAIRDVAAGVAGPLLVSYVLWTLQKAHRLGLQRLYFLARDGQILLKLARLLAPRLGFDIDLRYLYASRQAWHLPSVRTLEQKHLSWLLETSDVSSIRSVLRRVNVSPELVASDLAAAGWSAGSWDTPLDDAGMKRASECLMMPNVAAAIEAQAEIARQSAMAYLQKEGLTENISWALVDVGWRGRLQQSLVSLLGNHATRTTTGFYMGLNKDAPPDTDACQLHAFINDERNNIGFKDLLPEFASFAEIFCAADHGSTIGYADASNPEPILKCEQNTAVNTWGLPMLQKSIEAFAQHIAGSLNREALACDVREPVLAGIRRLIDRPSREEAVAFGSFPYENDQIGDDQRTFAVKIGIGDIIRSASAGQFAPGQKVVWRKGSLQISSPPVQWIGRCLLYGKGQLKRVRNKVRRILQ